jgi:RHS repeat-associated protein
VTEIGTGVWQHSNVWSGTGLTATYDPKGLHLHVTDPLGTRRVQLNAQGAVEGTCQNLPFGDALTCTPTALSTADDATEHHFTSKEYDAESGNDYFLARYYASSMGRMMSPDPSGLYFADPTNPQSLNLYAYVLNNPLINVDPDGLDCVYINNDTGAYEGFNRGDCDNSTTAKANSGYYFDGNATTLYTSDGTLQGQVTGIGGTGSDGNPLFDANPAGVSPSAPNQPVDVSTDLLNWASQQTIPTHGLWTYGNWAGSGGKGTPVDDVDTGAMKHDYCYHQGGFTAGSNYGGHSAALQACNQALCNAASKAEAKALAPITSAASKNQVPNDPGGHLMNEANAAADIIRYFSIVPFGNSCKGVNP